MRNKNALTHQGRKCTFHLFPYTGVHSKDCRLQTVHEGEASVGLDESGTFADAWRGKGRLRRGWSDGRRRPRVLHRRSHENAKLHEGYRHLKGQGHTRIRSGH